MTNKQIKYLDQKLKIDRILAVLGLIVLFVPFILIAMIQKINSPKDPVFFIQDRIGFHGELFKIVKFRTMKQSAPSQLSTAEFKDAYLYVTKLGKVLRQLSIDELPQLFNVVRGEMSLIGPRPLIPTEEPIQSLRFAYGVYAVRPGMTGLAQISGRDYLDDQQKALCDKQYVQQVSLRTDLGILFRSVVCVMRQDGIGYTIR